MDKVKNKITPATPIAGTEAQKKRLSHLNNLNQYAFIRYDSLFEKVTRRVSHPNVYYYASHI